MSKVMAWLLVLLTLLELFCAGNSVLMARYEKARIKREMLDKKIEIVMTEEP